MRLYNDYHPSEDERTAVNAERLFYLQFRSGEGFTIDVNGLYDKDVIIQQHVNPLNERLEDKKMIYINDAHKPIDWGDEITGYDNAKYLVITQPHNDSVYMTCKIRKLANRMKFNINGIDYTYGCILNNSMLYNESSYVGSSNAFEDEEIRALVVRYDEVTSKIKLFDYIFIEDKCYKVSNIDKKALIRQGEEFGVLQMTLIETIVSDIFVNFKNTVKGILRFARLKEAVYNSNARAFLCETDGVKTGDYVSFDNKREFGNDRTFIVISMVDAKSGYDSSFVLTCQRVLRWVGSNKAIHEYPARFIDNKTMLMESSSKLLDLPASVQQCQVQENKYTKTIVSGMRFISNGEVLKVIDVDRQTMQGVLTIRFETSSKTTDDNMELEIADYYKYFSRDENPTDPEEPTQPSGYELSITGESEIYTGFDDDYTATVKVDGVPLNGLQVDWSITNQDGTTTPYATIQDIDGYGCTILASNNTKHIGKIVILRVYLRDDSSIYAEKTIKIKPLF